MKNPRDISISMPENLIKYRYWIMFIRAVGNCRASHTQFTIYNSNAAGRQP